MTNPEKIDSDRRGFFGIAAVPLLVFGLGSRARAAAAPAPATTCFNPATLPAGQVAQRKGVNFRTSTDAAKQCGGCMYFSASAPGCGKCQILLNGPVAANTVCDAWTKKAG